MKAIVPANHYVDEGIFALEQERIFAQTWAFACFYSAVREHNSWVALTVAGRSVTIQNFAGELRCFLNVCSHRFCEIRLSPEGTGPLRCSYHGWTYDSEGLPTGIPHRPRFDGLTPECIGSLALTRYRVERCGEFVFVCLGENAPALRESMGSFFPRIESLSASLGVLVDTSDWNVECNWKILVESTLESYHLDFVHPGTFAKMKARFGHYEFDSLASSDLGKMDMENPQLLRFTKNFQLRPRGLDGYYHFSLFPVFLMSTSYGIVYSVQQITPLSARGSLMRSFLFHRAADPGVRTTEGMTALLHDSAVGFNRTVLAEDRRMCEAVQRGARQMGSRTGMLSDEESRIAAFHLNYMNFMELT